MNFAASPSISAQASPGNASNINTVVGVTRWGYTTVGDNTQGAAYFGQNSAWPNASYFDAGGTSRGAGKIGGLVAAACNLMPAACK